ncbi:MAG: DUF4230 domain-containing protein [Propionibacteriaceae bacterium]|jgi:hypothetical protein|nr:DUF4230 domain-containing protein [Propionibacteriaceae bacterium]
MKKLVVILIGIILVLASVITVVIMSPWDRDKGTNDTPPTGAPFQESVVKGFKISSLTYQYSNVVYHESVSQIAGIEIPFTKAYLAVRYDGVMEIGVDASRLTFTQSGTVVTIAFPPAQILSHSLVPGTTEVLFDHDNVFNHNKIADFTELFDHELSAMEDRARTSGMLLTASKEAKDQVKGFIDSLPGTDEYTFVLVDSAN